VTTPAVTNRLRPITARILDALAGPRTVWICAWALIPWLNAGANLLMDTGARSAVWEQSRAVVILNYAALSAAVVITLWGAERIARALEALRTTTPEVLTGDASGRFRALISCRRSTPRVVRSRMNPRNPPGRGGGRRPQTTAAQIPNRPAGGINTNWLVIGASPSRRRCSMTQPQGRRVLHRGRSRRRTWAHVLPANRGARASRWAD